MSYQEGYAPDFDYGNYVGRGFPDQGQPQQSPIYQQTASGQWPAQPSPVAFSPQQVPSVYQSPQFAPQQQHFPPFNQYQQPRQYPTGQQTVVQPMNSPPQLYQQNFIQQQQQQPSLPSQQFSDAFSAVQSSPDPLQYYQQHQSPQLPQSIHYPQPQARHNSAVQPRTSHPQASGSPVLRQTHQQNLQPQHRSPREQQHPNTRPQQQQQQLHSRAPSHQVAQPGPYNSHGVQASQRLSSPSQQYNASHMKHQRPQQESQSPAVRQHVQSQTPHAQARSQSSNHQPTQHSNNSLPQPVATTKIEQSAQPLATIPTNPQTIAPSLLQKKVMHVEVPVQRSLKANEPVMAPTPKRRKSNDGVPLRDQKDSPRPQQIERIHQPSQPPPSSSPLSELRSSQIPPTPTPASVDYQVVLLALSDEYINAAYHLISSTTGPELSEKHLHTYHDLIASGMGCLETVLNNYRISDARREARVRLRFAALLCEETENSDKAEEVLAKGITVCERARLTNLKYAMRHVQIRVWFKGKRSKGALKAVEKLIEEVEKLGLTHWIYAFRFLRVSLGVQVANSLSETANLARQLAAISKTAGTHSHVAVQIVAHALDALVHLRSQSQDGVDAAQRAIAAARTHQLSPEMESLPQAKTLLDCADLACSLVRFSPEQAAAKLQTMHGNLDSQAKLQGWNRDGSWLLPLGPTANNSRDIEADTCGILKSIPGGQAALTFQWLPRPRVYMLGFLLSGLASMHKSTGNERKAESFFKEGLKLTSVAPKPTLRSMTVVTAEVGAQQVMRVLLQIYIAFAYCSRSDWPTANKAIGAIRKELAKVDSPIDASIPALLNYLEAVSKHGQGDLAGALRLYRSDGMALPSEDSKASAMTVDPLRILCGLNSVLILRRAGTVEAEVPSIDAAESSLLLARLEPLCKLQGSGSGSEYGNKSLEAAFNILRATHNEQSNGDGTIIQTKQYLSAAVHAAKSVADNNLMCVVMNIMTQLFFVNIVGEQAEKSARTSRTLAEKSQNKLWTAVANRMYGDTMDRCGKGEEAAKAREVAQESMQSLPDTLQAALRS